MIIKAEEFHDFLDLVLSSKNHKDDWAITLYSKNEVSPNISFSENEPKLIRVQLVYSCSSFNLVFEKNISEHEFKSNLEFQILNLKASSVVKEYSELKIDYAKQLITVNDALGD